MEQHGVATPSNLLTLLYLEPHTHNSAVSTPLYTYMWAEPMVKLLCSRRGNQRMYIVSVTPYTPGADGVKNSLVGACELFCN